MTFRIADSEFRLHLTMREAIEYERRTGRSFFADAQSLAEAPTAEVLIGLLWACMLHHQPAATLDEVASALTLADLPRAADALRQLLASPFAQSGAPGGGAPPPDQS